MALPTRLPISSLKDPFYTGSVQRLYAVPGDEEWMVTETTSRGSVFDVGHIFDIEGSDVARAVFRHMLYSRMGDPALWQDVKKSIESAKDLNRSWKKSLLRGPLETLCERGALTHHGGMIDAVTGKVSEAGAPKNPSAFNLVKRYQILKPGAAEVIGSYLYDYSGFPHADRFVIPLEYIVRFGITGASSIYRRYLAMSDKERLAYQAELGMDGPLVAWQMLGRPINDCTTKFEPEDRSLNRQESLLVSSLTAGKFRDSLKLATLGGWAVRYLLEQTGLLLWDIKWEFAKDGNNLVFVDTIDTDSFRATRFFELDGKKVVVHFNKQSMRDYYRICHTDWLQGVAEAKEAARDQGIPFTVLLAEGQANGTYAATPDVDEDFLGIQVRKMEHIQEFMLGNGSAEAVSLGLQRSGEAELDWYSAQGHSADFQMVNGV